MMRKVCAWMGIALMGLTTLAQAANPAPASGHVPGQFIALDAATKTITVEDKDGNQLEAKYDDKTAFEAIRPGTDADVTAGKDVKVNGVIGEDGTSIEATVVEMLLAKTKIPAIVNKDQKFIVGKLGKDGEAWVVNVKGQKIKVTLGADVKYRVREDVKPGDMQAGEAIGVWMKAGVAQRVQLPNRQ